MSKSSPTPAGSPPLAADPALLGRHEAGLRTYLAGLHGAGAGEVDAVIREIMREAPGKSAFDDDPVVWMFAQGRRRIGHGGQRGDVMAPEAGEEEPVAGEDSAIAVHRAFGRLTNKQQEILRLKFQFGFSLAEIAVITGVSQTGAGGLLHAAMERTCRAAGATLSLGEGRNIDVRLTAYALDELEPADKRTFAQGIGDAKALLESSDAIRKVGQQLSRVLENGAPLPKRRRQRRGAAWWRGRSLGVVVMGVILLGGAGWYFLTRGEVAGRGEAPGSGMARAESSSQAGDLPGAATGPTRERGAVAGLRGPGRHLRPGEAEWERKPFGHGQGQVEGTDGAFDGDASAVASDGVITPGRVSDGSGQPLAQGGSLPEGGAEVEPESSNEVLKEEKETAPADDDSPDIPRAIITGAGSGGGGRVAGALVAPPAAHAMKPARPDVQEQVARPAVTPKEGSRIPDRHPPPQEFVPLTKALRARQWPKARDVRVSELTKRAPPETVAPAIGGEPMATRLEITDSPWDPEKQIVRAVVKARSTRPPARTPVNLVFAIDVSGSMAGPNRLPLVQEGIRLLADRLRADDRVTVVTYAAEAKEALAGTALGENGLDLRNCLTALEAAGQTNGADGLELAYAKARKNRIDPGLNAVVLCTDGNFNLGTIDEQALAVLAAQAAADGITLSVFGFGRTDRNDLRLELLATAGGGRSCYVNTSEEAERLLAGQISGLVETVAMNVALDVTFDRERVAAVARLDGGAGSKATTGEILSGSSLAALFEIGRRPVAKAQGPLAEVAVTYRLVGASEAGYAVRDADGVPKQWSQLDAGFRFSIAWAEFGRILKGEKAQADAGLDRLEAWVQRYLPEETGGYRRELLDDIAAARLAAGN